MIKMCLPMKNILVATLGTWALVPEVLGFTNPNLVDLYRHHPEAEQIDRRRSEYDIRPAEELWIVTSDGRFSGDNLNRLLEWFNPFDPTHRPLLRIWRVSETEDLSSASQCRLMAEAIFRIVLLASKNTDRGQLLLSLAGGRKTMSTDLQRAAALFGCHALLHVIQSEEKDLKDAVRALGPEDFTAPLPACFKDAVTPLVVGSYETSPVLEAARAESTGLDPASYPVGLPESGKVCGVRFGPAEKNRLCDALEGLMKDAAFLFANNAMRIQHAETLPNFMALYSLSPGLIKTLKRIHIGIDQDRERVELDWLSRLPKTDLHCHLGGVAAPEELIEIAAAEKEALVTWRGRLEPWLAGWQRRLDGGEIPADLDFKELREAVLGVPQPFCVVSWILLFEQDPGRLEDIIYGSWKTEEAFCGIGFKPYEKLGDLQGSGLLQSEACLRVVSRVLARKARQHNVRYLELRCSPCNYTEGGLSADVVSTIITDELDRQDSMEYNLLFIASRHGDMSRIKEHIALADRLLCDPEKRFSQLKGFDLAGSEKVRRPAELRDSFLPMMEKCLHLTIHAGETEEVGRIWEAVYHLSAERIGHGLTLGGNPTLMKRFKDRGIALEMCPSSNVQIVGFRDNYLPATARFAEYPLKKYLNEGLRVTINTDNPGISRTNWTRELHRAARLTPGGLSLWDVFLLIRNGFKAAFAEWGDRQRMLREAEAQIIEIIKRGLPE